MTHSVIEPVAPSLMVLCSCGHPLDRHDRVGTRYCAATAASDVPRGCICVSSAAAPLATVPVPAAS